MDAAQDFSVQSQDQRYCFSDRGYDEFSVARDDALLLGLQEEAGEPPPLYQAPGAGLEESQTLAQHALSALPGITSVHALLGMGSCGHVFRCSWVGEAEELAVKVLRVANTSEESREAALVNLAHPNLIQIRQVIFGPPLCLVMELCRGGTLGAFLHVEQNRPLAAQFSPMARARGALDVAAAVEYLHALNLVHRDVKSSNCFLTTAVEPSLQVLPAVKLGDLGSCRVVDEGMTNLVGTYAYMAPEVLGSAGGYGLGADIFSFGILLNELLSGDKPFKAERVAHRIPLLISAGHRPVLAAFASAGSEAGDTLQPALQALVAACWEPDPLSRPSGDVVKARLDEMFQFYGATV